MTTIAISGASGNLGNATLTALLSHALTPPSSIIALTSSHPNSPTWTRLRATNPHIQIRHASFEDPASYEAALKGVHKFFLVSTPHIAMDFEHEHEHEHGSEKPEGRKGGREAHHRVAIDAAVRARVRHVYYSSLAFAWDARAKGPGRRSKAGVMRAHLRTEAYLDEVRRRRREEEEEEGVTVIREGLYNESWPLYLGYFDAEGGDERTVVPLAGDGKVCWTAIGDLGVANAVVLVAPSEEYDGKTFYLSTRPEGAKSLREIAELVGRARGKEVSVKVVGREEHERYYVQERARDGPAVRWWASTYEALEDGECLIDDPTLEKLLSGVGVKPTSIEETISKMVKKA
ncbi:NAD(P)-binding protein [Hypoxylon sp. EC38]|nr:NAD(P)-binding protein [Hypoxylon sp. EC38]